MQRYATVSLNILKQEAIPSSDAVPAMLARWGLTSQTQECFWVIAYDPLMNIRTAVEIARGGYAKVDVHFPAIYTAVLAVGADRFMVAHNHPNEKVTPTKRDVELTIGIMEGANALGLYLEDHWIVSPSGKSFSFVANGLMIPAKYEGAAREAASK